MNSGTKTTTISGNQSNYEFMNKTILLSWTIIELLKNIVTLCVEIVELISR